jgi:hypothetical protein
MAAIPLACATAVETSGADGAVGAGGASSANSSASGTGGKGPLPCQSAVECAALADTCNLGACVNGTCVKAPANELGGCSDGKFCTQNDSCHGGVCQGTPTLCPPSDACHLAACNVAQDKCVEVPGNDGAQCDDSDPCTLAGTCSSGACSPGPPINCSVLDDICGQGVCDPQQGCVKKPKNDGTPCDDKLYCTINDQCTNGLCAGQPNPCAPPGDVCLVGTCSEAQKTCVAVPGNDGVACDDKNACTAGEKCAAGKCVGGLPTNQGGACDDHDACTTVDSCNNGLCVGGAPISQCGGGDGCCPAGCTLLNDPDCVPACCGDNQNPFPPANNCFQGAAWIAWEYIPACSFNLTRLELHTDQGSVALLDTVNNLPGSTLFQGMLGAPDPQGWEGANVAPKIALIGGQKYWIAEAVGQCSIASQGVGPTYYASFTTLAGPWQGPYGGNTNIWTSHVVGECP